ncbi:DUF4032 domain-containing protein [Neomicrococcus lactis]|uniref:DUF4032 domain-containing protein n=1 Tax=Neomicrococcus lactis TaxID=732241 RepID=A0A7W8YBG6_9MICC|nr:DUF4032 domain-containing protein [Neomicrococcus lactis]MBB5598436.1 hypothetical protein [Neomicrococcus lactis]
MSDLRIISANVTSALVDFPWDTPLEEWPTGNLAAMPRGLSRHVVRFAYMGNEVVAVKETVERPARHEYNMLRRLNGLHVPSVEPVAIVLNRTSPTGEDLGAALVTKHLSYSLPYRALFSRKLRRDTLHRLIDALAVLMVKLHLVGFYWGDVSLSNVLFRRDAEGFAAFLVDAETGELHPQLTRGQRQYDLQIAMENIAGEVMDLTAGGLVEEEFDAVGTGQLLVDRYRALWAEITHPDSFDISERWRVDERVRSLNKLGFDVGEISLETTGDGHRLTLVPRVVEPGHHTRRLMRLTGLDVGELQARRILNDIDAYTARRHPGMSEELGASWWMQDVFEKIMNGIPEEMCARLEPAQIVHEVLEHRWYISEHRGANVPLAETVQSYVDNVLAHRRDERAIVVESQDITENAD